MLNDMFHQVLVKSTRNFNKKSYQFQISPTVSLIKRLQTTQCSNV
jgi:hypothetical protein